jgi:aspartate racemase
LTFSFWVYPIGGFQTSNVSVDGSMNEEKIIGVVGGVGPFAGIDLLSKIVEQTLASKDQDHLTVISLSQPQQIPDRSEYLLGQIAINPAYAIADQLRRLEQAGAAVAGVPCNTAHAPAIFNVIREELQAAGSRINLLHMMEEVARHVGQYTPGIKRLGVLATTGTYRSRVYSHSLEPLGFKVIMPDEALQVERIHPAIYDPAYGLKARGVVTEKARQALLAGGRYLQKEGAEAIILGCTEIPLAIKEKEIEGMMVIDATLVLARALIREANPAKLKREA